MERKLNLLLAALVLCIISCQPPSGESSQSTYLKNPWEFADSIVQSIKVPEFKTNEYNISEFGAVGDGITDCSKAIHDAIEACSNAGGGVVLIPPGTFLTGAVQLKSNVNLHISEGAELLFTTDKSKYLPVVHSRFEGMECMNYSPFIYAYKQENIAITGKGKINGQGEAWWHWKGKWSGSVDHGFDPDSEENQKADNKLLYQMVADNTPVSERIFGKGHYLRPSFIQTYNCKNILIEDITIIQSPMWIIHPVLSESITVRGVKIESLGPNNDGCNPESSKNILIEDCYFNTGDDCIAIKSGRNDDGRRFATPSENIVIRNCTMVEGHGGVVIGSEISGNARNIFAENCVMDSPNLDRAIRIKSNSVRGGIVEHIYARNIEVKQVKEAVLKINMYYATERDKNIPKVNNIWLDNVNSYNSEYAVWINAYEEQPAKDINIINCTFTNVNKNNYINNVENLRFENVSINGEKPE